jgi:hypothetical protein
MRTEFVCKRKGRNRLLDIGVEGKILQKPVERMCAGFIGVRMDLVVRGL